MHGYLGHDGRPPAEFLAHRPGRGAGYGVEIVDGAVTDVTGDPDGGRVPRRPRRRDASVAGRRVLLATGLVDELPDIPGVAEQWGQRRDPLPVLPRLGGAGTSGSS